MKQHFFWVLFLLPAFPYMAVTVGNMELERCHIPNYAQEVLCGTHRVFENRRTQSGREIDIKFAVIPSITEAKEPDPLVMLAGGPGQGAMSMGGPFTRVAFSEIRETRDIILIDQRGMGKSHPLRCELPEQDLLTLSEEEQTLLSERLLRECLAGLEADVTQYTQDSANRDIHEILLALDYKKINLYGISWGTRSALLYSNQFPNQVRTVVMDGNVPVENKVSLYAAIDAEIALQTLFQDCINDAGCNEAFPELESDFNEVLESFGESGIKTTVKDANTGETKTIVLGRGVFVNAIRNILYLPEFSRLIPMVIKQAKDNNYQTLSGLTAAFGDPEMAIGASLTILCSEELSRISNAEKNNMTNEGFVGDAFIKLYDNACRIWPKAPLPEIYQQIKPSEIPTLILSGKIDPITPPRWGDKMAETMKNSLHLIAPNTGHNVAPKGCASELMSQFINEASVENIDGSCLDMLKRPSFFVDASGPARSVSND